MDTKERISQTALEMFSKRGYSAVSIRDICKEVGIKESTVYYHFENKRDIFKTLEAEFIERGQKLIDAFYGRLNGGACDPSMLDDAFFERVAQVFTEDYLLDDFNIRFIRTLAIERLNDDGASSLFNKHLIDAPLDTQTRIFDILCKMGITKGDARDLAETYYSPVFMYYEKYMLSGEVTEEKKNLFRNAAYAHFGRFDGGNLS